MASATRLLPVEGPWGWEPEAGDDHIPVVVIDRCRSRWFCGNAGDDAPTFAAPGSTWWHNAPAKVGDDRVETNETKPESESAKDERINGENLRRHLDPRFPRDVMVTASIFEDADSSASLRDLCDQLQASPATGIVHVALHEWLIAVASGSTTALCLSFGESYISLVGFWLGDLLRPTARRIPVATEALFDSSPEDWFERTELPGLIIEAVNDAPIDLRLALLEHIVVAGNGRRDKKLGYTNFGAHLKTALQSGPFWQTHAAPPKITVVDAPERVFLGWIGGSILGAGNMMHEMADWQELRREQSPHPTGGRREGTNSSISWDLTSKHQSEHQRQLLQLVPADWDRFNEARPARAKFLVGCASLTRILPPYVLVYIASLVEATLDWPQVPALRALLLPVDHDVCLSRGSQGPCADQHQETQELGIVRSIEEEAELRESWHPCIEGFLAAHARVASQWRLTTPET